MLSALSQQVQTNLVEQRESSKGLENYDSETVTVSGVRPAL